MTVFSTATCLLLLLAAQAPEPSAPPPPAEPLEVRHVPQAQVSAGERLVLKAQVAPAWRLGSLVAHHRAAGEATFQEVPFERSADGGYAAVIPVAAEQRRPLEYYVTARDTDGADSVRFASAQAPHPVLVEVPTPLLEREALLQAHGHRRSRVGVFAEYVDYGRAWLEDGRYADRYYRLETDYLYRLVTPVGGLRLDSIRIGVGHLRATTAPWNTVGQGPVRAGLDYGFSEVEVGFSPSFGLAGRVVLGGNASGFAAGVGGRMRVGRPQGSRVELEGEYVSGLGGAATVRLGWDTVPAVPMSAAVQVTNVPTGPTGVRLLYRADYRLAESVLVGAQVGYQARSTVGGGPSLGLAASYGW